MSSLRELFEEALQEADPKLGKNMAGVVGYNNALVKGGQWKGPKLGFKGGPGGMRKRGKRSPNPYHDALGRFTNFNLNRKKNGASQKATSMSWGSKFPKVGIKNKKFTAQTGRNEAGRSSGSGEYHDIKNPQPLSKSKWSVQGKSKLPSDDRILARTGKTKKASGKAPGVSKEAAMRHYAHRFGKNWKEIYAKMKKKQGPAKGAGAPKQGASAKMASFDSDQLFLNRLFEGGEEQHPLAFVDGARESVHNALEALYSMPDGAEYDEVVEAAEYLDAVSQLLDYDGDISEDYDEEYDWE